VAHRVQMLAQGLASLNHEMLIFSPYRYQPGPLSVNLEGITLYWGACIDRQSADRLFHILRKRYLIFKTARRVLRQGVDWLILYDMGLDGLPLFLLAKQAGCRVAVDNCDINYIYTKTSLRDIYLNISQQIGHRCIAPHLDLNFVISRYIDKHLEAIAPKVPRVMVPAPVDIDKFQIREKDAQTFRDRFALQDSFIIGYFGSPHKVKGLEILLQAAGLLAKQGKKFKLLITGRTDRNPHLLRIIDEFGLRDWIVLTGFIPDEDLIAAMSAADILVEPKIEHGANWAAFPQKLAEYLAMGRPIVASAIGDITQYLQDQENALLCRAGDSHSLADALERMMQNRALREKVSLNARQTAEKYFDCRIIARQVESALLR